VLPKARTHPPTRALVARNLQRRIEQKGTNPHAVAREAEIDPSSFSKAVKGEQAILVETLAHVAKALGCELVDLIRESDD